MQIRVYGLRKEQLVGITIGALVGAAVSGLACVLGCSLTLNEGLVWGAVVGGILSAIPQFTRSGAVLTRSTHRGWNLLVGAVGGLIYIFVIVVLTIFLARLLL